MFGLGTIGLLIRNAPTIITGLQGILPDKYDGALNKVKTTAIVAGGMSVGMSQTWTPESGWRQTVEMLLLLAGTDPVWASPVSAWLAPALTFIGSTTAAYAVGYGTREDPAKLSRVE